MVTARTGLLPSDRSAGKALSASSAPTVSLFRHAISGELAAAADHANAVIDQPKGILSRKQMLWSISRTE